MVAARTWPAVAFVLLQLLDGGLTYVGIRMMGPGIEANPLVALAVWGWGLSLGLLCLKFPVAVLGVCIFLEGWRRTVLILSGLHLFAAVLPWLYVFYVARLLPW